MVSTTELAGYIASVLVAVSLVMASFLLLRILNLLGAIFFVIYGLLLGSIPIILTNAFIVAINIYYLLRMLRPSLSGFEYVSIGKERRRQVEEFVQKNKKDIQSFFPDFSLETLDWIYDGGGFVYLALRDLAIQGIALCAPVPDPDSVDNRDLSQLFRQIHEDLFPAESLILPVDYVVKRYRGMGLTNRLHERIEAHRTLGVRYILAPVLKKAWVHRRFLLRHGYRLAREEGEYALLVKTLES